MKRREFLKGAAASAGAATIGKPAIAQSAMEIPFYYPVAVGGPITKLIDKMAADFQKENPNIKVNPVYSGTYQETLVKLITAHKSGNAPALSCVLSTDMFTLIDDDVIVPFDNFIKSDDDKAWLKSFFPAFMENSQTGGKTWGAPFQRSTVVLYWNKDLFKEGGLDPDKAPANWAEQLAFAQKLTKADGSGTTTQWGIQVPSTGFPYWLFQGFSTQAGAILMNQDGNRTAFDKPEVVEALTYWVDLSRKHKVHPTGIVEWGTTSARLLRAQSRNDVDDDGQPHECPQQRKVPVWCRHAAGRQAARQSDRRRKLPHFQERIAGAAGGGLPLRALGNDAGARRAMVRRHRLCGRAQGCVRYARAKDVRLGVPGGGGRARPARVCRG